MRTVLVTGASRGIGRAIAMALADDGWRVLVHWRERRDEADFVARAVEGEAAPFGADLAKKEDCARLFAWATSLGKLHAVVNNAGVYVPSPFAEADDDAFERTWQSQYETNFGSTLRVTRAFVRYAIAEKIPSPKVLAVASRVGFKGEAGASAYAASKAAQINLVRSLAVELAPNGIGVFGIAPGWVETAMARDGMAPERRAEIEATIPLGRLASPDDCAAAAAFLLSDRASYLSGVVLDVNGASYVHLRRRATNSATARAIASSPGESARARDVAQSHPPFVSGGEGE